MNCTASQSSNSGWEGNSPCVPKFSLVATIRSRSTLATRDSQWSAPWWANFARPASARTSGVWADRPARIILLKRRQEAGDPDHQLGGMQEIARVRMCVSRPPGGLKHQLRGAFRVCFPNSGNLIVLRFPVGDGGSPITKTVWTCWGERSPAGIERMSRTSLGRGSAVHWPRW